MEPTPAPQIRSSSKPSLAVSTTPSSEAGVRGKADRPVKMGGVDRSLLTEPSPFSSAPSRDAF